MSKEIERRVIPVTRGEVRAQKDDDGNVGIKGMAAVYNSRTDLGWFEEEIAPGAFDNAISKSDIRGLFNHDPNYVLGRTKSKTLKVASNKDGLAYEIPSLPKARADVAEAIERGDVDGNSFSFTVKSDEWTKGEEGKTKDFRRILEVEELFDVGPVTYPAYTDTSVALRSRDAALGEKPKEDTEVEVTATGETEAIEERVPVAVWKERVRIIGGDL